MSALWLAMHTPEHKPNCLKFGIEHHVHNIPVVIYQGNNVKKHTAIRHNRSLYYLMIFKLGTPLLSNQRSPQYHLLSIGCLCKLDVTWVELTSTTYGVIFSLFCT